MRGIKARRLRKNAREQGYCPKGYRELSNGQRVCVGTRAIYQKLKKENKI